MEAREKPFPFIIIRGSIQAATEVLLASANQVLCTVEGGLVEATLGLMAVYYIFMFNYPGRLKNFFLYLQKCILQIQDGRKLPASIISFVNDLDKISKSMCSM